jgi:tyrosyl-tRNA synthetase
MKNILEELNWRGLIYQKTPNFEEAVKRKSSVYLGIDPTGESLHIGHLLGILTLKRFLNFGHKIFILLGGGTALIGDPSGKEKERPILSQEEIEKNKEKIKKQLQRFFKIDNKKVFLVDNGDWLKKIKLIDFLRDVGKFVPTSSMLDLEFVKNRLQTQEGMSFAEFTYQLLQAYDFLILFQKYEVEVQIGGSDQWGNIVQGIELIRKKLNRKAYGLTYPLIIDPQTGKKLGKTEEGENIWLEPKKTNPFDFYQFFINLNDDLAPILIRYYSFKSKEEIEEIEREWLKDKSKRLIQKNLAEELTELVFGKKEKEKTIKLTKILFETSFENLTLADLKFLQSNLPFEKEKTFNLEKALLDLNFANSKSEAKRLIEQKGVNFYHLHRKYYLIKKGKNKFGLVEVEK